MGKTDSELVAGCCFGCLILVTTALHATGFFTPHWVTTDECEARGIYYSCCGGNSSCGRNSEDVDERVQALEMTTLVIMTLTFVGLCCGTFCGKGDDDIGWCLILGACCFLLYPVAGLLSVIGCIILATSYETSALGYSFYLCVTSGSMILLLTVCGCCLICAAAKDGDEPKTTSQPSYELSTISQNAQVAAPQPQPDRSSYMLTVVRHIQIVRVMRHYQQ